jgi:HlyD family secretion protein
VDAYPNRPFEGSVLKVEPQATVQQNVTMFNVLVRIPNPAHLLKPGMNTEVEIHVGQRDNVLAVPNAALRTPRDVASAAQVLGLDPNAVQLPPGVTAEQVRSAFQKRMSGQELTPAEQRTLAAMRQMMMRAGGGQGGGLRRNAGESSSYIVFTLHNGKPTPVQIRTGLTDLDYIEVLTGLSEHDTVLVLPSASLLNSQRDMQQRMRNIGGLPGVQQQQAPARPQATPARP